MKLLIAILISFAGCCSALAQNLLNTSLITPESHVAYRGYPNDLKLVGFTVNSTTKLITSTDTLRRISDERGVLFTYKPKTKNQADTVKIFNNGKCLKSIVFTIEGLGKAQVFFGNIRDSLVTKQELMNNPGLICSFWPALVKCDSRVMNFEAVILKKTGEEIILGEKYISTPGNIFSEKQLSQIKEMKLGDAILFKEATTVSPDGKPNRIYMNLKLTLKGNPRIK